MRCTTLTTLLTGVMLYLGMGALVFVTLESPKEKEAHENLLKAKKDFLMNNSCISEVDFQQLVTKLVSAVEAGLDLSSLPANLTSRWDMGSAFFFCGTIITTIGFGNLSPRTWFGQLFCVCYALVGIPMFGILLAGVGDHMGTVLRRAVAKIENLFLKRKIRPTTVRVISAVLSILIGCLIFLAVPTVVFQRVEKWSFLESLYFVVITLTTVGFGDYVPGGGYEGGTIFKPLVLLWIVFGLAYFASILTMIGNWLRVLSKRTRAEMEELRAHATDWTQNMDFRIPNPLEFNDPFLLQRRRWKRSERRRIRRGAQGTLGYWDRGGSENGHLPNRWAGLSSSMSQLEARSTLERSAGAKPGPRLSACEANRDGAAVGGQGPRRSYQHILGRTMSLPVAPSTSELDYMQGRSYSGSNSPSDSRSGGSSLSVSSSGLHSFQPYCAHSVGEGEEAPEQHQDKHLTAEKPESDTYSVHNEMLVQRLYPCSSPQPPEEHSPSPEVLLAASADCQLLDFFGENLAYIDESTDTLSDFDQPAANKEKRRRPRKPKKCSTRRELPHMLGLLRPRRLSLQPPSNPPTPPPDSSAPTPPPDSSASDYSPSDIVGDFTADITLTGR